MSHYSIDSHLHVPEEVSAEVDNVPNIIPQPSRQRRASEVPKKAIKVVKKVVIPLKKPHLRRRAHPHNRWVAFQSTPGREEDNEVLSLFRGEGLPDSEYAASDIRRQSFDDRIDSAFKDKGSSRFQSLPDVKRYAVEKGEMDDWQDEFPQEEQDNLSTANLLIVYEGTDDDEDTEGAPLEPPPHLVFTRASVSPCRSDTGSKLENKGEKDPRETKDKAAQETVPNEEDSRDDRSAETDSRK